MPSTGETATGTVAFVIFSADFLMNREPVAVLCGVPEFQPLPGLWTALPGSQDLNESRSTGRIPSTMAQLDLLAVELPASV